MYRLQIERENDVNKVLNLRFSGDKNLEKLLFYVVGNELRMYLISCEN